MKKGYLSRSTRKTYSARRQFLSNEGGVVGIEFTLLAPVILLVLFSLFEFSRAFEAMRKVDRFSATFSDLLGQVGNLRGPEVGALVDAISIVMEPFDRSGLRVGAAAAMLFDNDVEPLWTYGTGAAAPAIEEYAAISADPLPVLIRVEIEYSVNSLFGTFFGIDEYNLTNSFTVRSRITDLELIEDVLNAT